jgi:tRNA dimethylallyltransferase
MSRKTLNLGILAHVDAGKTTLTERLLFSSGVIDRPCSAGAGTTVTGWLPPERRRGITINSAVASFPVGDVDVNLIDMPGHPDLIAEADRVPSVLDGVVLAAYLRDEAGVPRGRLRARRRAVAIYGPTSSGKTALSLDVCEAASERGLRPVVLNADSRQVYAGLDIGTSKIKPSQMRGFEHRLLDVAEPSSKLSLEAYAQLARAELASLAASEDALPVLVGGTGVYVRSVVQGWDLTGTGPLRRSLERDFPRSDVKGAYQVLTRLAPEVARRVHPNNYEVILNALVRRMAGQESNEAAGPFAFAVYGLDRGEAETDRQIETTLDAQIRCGLLAEIAELDQRYRLVEQARRPGRRRNVASQTHGYREFVRVAASTGKPIAALDGTDLAAARAEALGHIRAYSRRQRSWFRKLGASRIDHRSAVKIIVSRLQ